MPPPRILVTRAPHQASALADHLRALGAEPVLIPTIELSPPTSFDLLDAALATLDTFHWLLFTSANAVDAFCNRRERPIPNTKIAAIGSATARALTAIGLTPDLVPPQATAESFAAALLPHALQPDGTPTRFLLVRAEEAREHLPDTLRTAGATVTVVPAYRNTVPAGSIDALRTLFTQAAPDAIAFTSSSTARNLFELLAAANIPLPAETVLASIGPVTSATMRESGHSPHTEAEHATVEALAENLVKYLALRKTT